MTQQMQEALEKRGIVWGARNAKVAEEVRKELSKPTLSMNLWIALHELYHIGNGYHMRIAPQL